MFGLLLLATDAPKQAPLLTAADLDPAAALPPPAANSVQERVKMNELYSAECARTDAEKADSALNGEAKNASIFASAIGPAFDLKALPATEYLMKLARATGKDASDRGKDEF